MDIMMQRRYAEWVGVHSAQLHISESVACISMQVLLHVGLCNVPLCVLDRNSQSLLATNADSHESFILT